MTAPINIPKGSHNDLSSYLSSATTLGDSKTERFFVKYAKESMSRSLEDNIARLEELQRFAQKDAANTQDLAALYRIYAISKFASSQLQRLTALLRNSAQAT